MLQDHRRLEIGGDFLVTVKGSQRGGAVNVESRHAVALVIFVKVGEVAGNQHRAHVAQLDQQAAVAGRVARRREHDHAAVAEHILVTRQGFDLAAAADPARERRRVDARGGWCGGQHVPVPLADQQRRGGKCAGLSGVVAVVVADADVFDLLGLDVEFGKLLRQRCLGCCGARAQGLTRIPHHVLVATADQVAAEGELDLGAPQRPCIGKAQVDFGGRLRRPAIGEPREGDLWRRLRQRERTGDDTRTQSRQQ